MSGVCVCVPCDVSFRVSVKSPVPASGSRRAGAVWAERQGSGLPATGRNNLIGGDSNNRCSQPSSANQCQCECRLGEASGAGGWIVDKSPAMPMNRGA